MFDVLCQCIGREELPNLISVMVGRQGDSLKELMLEWRSVYVVRARER